jgi:hypothetical protein
MVTAKTLRNDEDPMDFSDSEDFFDDINDNGVYGL